MSITRRKFVSTSAAAGGLLLLGTGAKAAADKKWKDVAAWNHAWDALDAVTYEDDGKLWDVAPAKRVDSVPDPIAGWPLARDKSNVMRILTDRLVPGPVYQAPDGTFGARPSWYSDTIIPHNPDEPSYWYSLHSALMTVQAPEGEATKKFEWEQPWWGAVLVRGVGPFGGHNQAYVDGNPGMVTISRSPSGTVIVRSWVEGMETGPSLNSLAPYEENTALVMWHAKGEESWLEVNYRGIDGVLQTRRRTGPIGGRRFDDLHSGLTHTNCTSCIGIARGTPSVAQTDAVREWAAPFIPAYDLPEPRGRQKFG